MATNNLNVNGIQVLTCAPDAYNDLQGTAGLSVPGKTRLILPLPHDGNMDMLLRQYELTKSFVDEYIFCYDKSRDIFRWRYDHATDEQGAIEPDGEESLPKLVRNYLHVDVPFDYARDEQDALERAWRQTQPGDRLIVLSDAPDRVEQVLRDLSATTQSGTEAPPSNVPFYDEPLSRRMGSPADTDPGTTDDRG